ncbi:MAG: 4Fe-4S binding protein [Spirochaetaceae bacterium]|jgi:2-oxoglutarate ferredoxin oxidoreductase subunit delta|nr:4Fe-4S binding protein [Spirochaetaceae bacterium]
MARKGKIVVDREFCKGCFLCISACPVKVLEKDSLPNSSGSYPVRIVKGENCIACGNCYTVCPDLALSVYTLAEGEAV